MVLHECQSKQEYHKAVEQNLMASLLLLIARTHTEKKSNIRPMMVGLQQIMPAIEHIGLHYMNPISGECRFVNDALHRGSRSLIPIFSKKS